MSKVISKEEALDTLVRLARMKDKEFDLNEMGNIDVIEKSYLILNQALDDVPTSTDIEEALDSKFKLFADLNEEAIDLLRGWGTSHIPDKQQERINCILYDIREILKERNSNE
jgi:hypothetical protein